MKKLIFLGFCALFALNSKIYSGNSYKKTTAKVVDQEANKKSAEETRKRSYAMMHHNAGSKK